MPQTTMQAYHWRQKMKDYHVDVMGCFPKEERDVEQKLSISPKLTVELHDVEERLNKIETRITLRMKEGQLF